jgi:hypothetical protein
MRGKSFVFISILLIAALGLGWFVYSRWSGTPSGKPAGADSQTSKKQSSPSTSETSSGRIADDPNRVKSGPDYKPIEPILGAEKSKEKAQKDPPPDPMFDYGKTEPVKGNTNPQVRSVAEALRDKNHPERLSPLIPPKPFNLEAYKQNPKAYLDVVEPGRVFQSAQPAKDVPRLRPLSPQLQEVAQGKSIKLKVQATPNYPVTFTSFDLGRFSNQLTSMTVEANEVGVAEVEFIGAPGTINEVNILASSPMTSGQVKYIVNVTR